MFARSKEVDGDLLRVMEDDELEEHVGLDGLMVKKLRKKMVWRTICFLAPAHARGCVRKHTRMRTHTTLDARRGVCILASDEHTHKSAR